MKNRVFEPQPQTVFEMLGAKFILAFRALLPAVCLLEYTAPAFGVSVHYQLNAQHSGRTSTHIDPTSLQHAWTAPDDYNYPVIAGNVVVASRYNRVYSAFDLRTGRPLWSIDEVYSYTDGTGPAVFDDKVVYAVGRTDTHRDSKLVVRNLFTGELEYSIDLQLVLTSNRNSITLYRDTTANRMLAFTSGPVLTIELGESSGQILGMAGGASGSASLPSVIGDSVTMISTGQFYAYNFRTNAMNHFYESTLHGGAGSTAVVDEANRVFYVNGFATIGSKLASYSYLSHDQVVENWRIPLATSIALGPDGTLFTTGAQNGQGYIHELSPQTGEVIRSAIAPEGLSSPPIITDGFLWARGTSSILAFDLETLKFVRSFPTSSINTTALESIATIGEAAVIINRSGSVRPTGFDVYLAPSPGDFDSDGDVDGADFVAWQTHYPTAIGAALADGDADGDGDVDGADFVVWQIHFPTSAGGAIAPVPEPAAFWHCALAAIGFISARRVS